MTYQSTILIVDDQAVGRRTLQVLLAAHNYHLAFAGDGPEALVKAAELRPDLILLDVMMPGMDGFEVCRRLRADPLLAEVPVIMVTTLDDRDSRVRGIEAGADDFISKPFDSVELRARVHTVTKLNRYRRLHLERAKFEWVVQQADDGYLMVNSSGAVLYANPQARLYLDMPPDDGEPITGTLVELAGKQYRFESQEAWATPVTEPAERAPRYLVRPESNIAGAFWLQVDTLDVSSGMDEGWIIRLRDVTDQVGAKRDRRAFNSMIHHKLRTPLMGMVGGIEYLAGSAPDMSMEEITELVQLALGGVRRLRSTIEDILQYLDAPGRVGPGQQFDLSQLQPLVTEIGSNLEIESVTVSCPDELANPRLLLSRRAVELALWEILENAEKFHPQELPRVEVSVAGAGANRVSLRIQDDGVAVSPEHLGQLWVPYYQGEKSFTGQAPGMGLGLALVASLVWEVGGTCRAYNRVDGPGVVVELVLPLGEN